MSGPDILTSPVRVNERSRTAYFFDGYVSVEIVSGTEEQQRAVLALVAQAQRMAQLLRIKVTDAVGCEEPEWTREAEAVLRDARVMSGGIVNSEGT